MMTNERYMAPLPFMAFARKHNTHKLCVIRDPERPPSVPPVSLSHRVPLARKVKLAHRRLDACGASSLDSRRALLRLAELRGDKLVIEGVLASLGE